MVDGHIQKLHGVANLCFFSCLRHFLIYDVHINVCGCVCVYLYTQVVIMNDLLFYNKHAERRRSRRRGYDV